MGSDTNLTTVVNKKQAGKSGTIYKSTGSLLVINECSSLVPRQFEESTRGDVTCFSDGSARRMRRYLRESLSEYRVMLTLTYPGFFPSNGKSVKEHLRRFCQELKRYRAARGGDPDRFSAFWFIEFQERGAPHFHIFCTDEFPSKWVATTWYFIVGSEDSRHLQAGTRIESIRSGKHGIMAYAAKYAAKQAQKIVPAEYQSVGRFWGVYGRRSVMSAATWVDATKAKSPRLSYPVFSLMKQIESLLMDGQMELIKRDDGVAVFTIHTNEARRRIVARICHIACVTLCMDNMFTDAEVEEGETLNQMLVDKLGSRWFDSNPLTIDQLVEIAVENRRAKNLQQT